MTGAGHSCMISRMRLPSALTWLVDEASTVPGADHFLTTLGAQLSPTACRSPAAR